MQVIDALQAPPRRAARIAGFFYLLVIATAPLAMFIRNGLLVQNDAAGSAANILGQETLYRLSIVFDLVSSASYIVVTGLFYVVFKQVDRTLSATAALFSLVGIAVSTVGSVFDIAALTILHGTSFLGAFTGNQTNALALLTVRLGGQAVNTGIVFFGCYCVSLGWLIFRSSFVPSIFGAGMIVAGMGWLSFLYQPLAAALTPFNMISGLGEVALAVWLIAVGPKPTHVTEPPGSPSAVPGVHTS